VSIWSSLTNAVGGALKNLGNTFGGDPSQSVSDRFGHALSAAYDIGIKAPTDALSVVPKAVGGGFHQFVNLDQRAYTDLISHPVSDVIDMQNRAMYSLEHGKGITGALSDITSKQSWIDSWENSAHYSPGQEIVLGANNAAAAHNFIGTAASAAYAPVNAMESFNKNFGNNAIKSGDVHAIDQLVGGNNWGNRIASGSVDGLMRTYLDPMQKVLKLGTEGIKTEKAIGGMGEGSSTNVIVPGLKAVKNNPIQSGGDIEKVMGLQRTQRLVNWSSGKDAATIAEHPAFRGNAFKWSIASALSGAGTPEESTLLMRTLMGDRQAWNQLATTNAGLAFRQANMLAPAETMEKFAIAPGDYGALDDWLQPVEKTKAAAASAQLSSKQDQYQGVLDAAGSLVDRTSSSKLAEMSAQSRSNLKYAAVRDATNPSILHPSRVITSIQDHAFNVPVKIYHALTDKPAMGFINHGDDSAPDSVRSWLNKSSTLTADEKQTIAEKYARYDKGQRAAGWSGIEEHVYSRVADAHGLDHSVMADILNQTRERGQLYANGAKSGAYGVIDTPNGSKLNLLPTGDGEIVAHPDLITQLQQGANPMANLSDVERAMERMSKSGLMPAIQNMGAGTSQFLADQLDRVYGVWKPLSLLTMHRAYNHIGDDYLRAVSKLGGMTMAGNAVEGAGNFVRNRLSRFTTNSFVRNAEGQWEQQVNTARAQFHGLLSQSKDQRFRMTNGEVIPDENRVTAAHVRSAADRYTALRDNRPAFVQPKHRLGTGTSVVTGTNIRVEDAFGGPNADYHRQLTSSQQFFESQINDSAHNLYQVGRSQVGRPGFDVINASENPGPWLKAYLHYANNQLRPDPVAGKLLRGANPNDVEAWLRNNPSGRAYMRDLHRSDTTAQVQAVQDHIDTYLPSQNLRQAAVTGGVKKEHVEQQWQTASQRPNVNGNLNLMIHGGHPHDISLKNTTQKILKWTGSMPDDIIVRHPVFNELYKSRVNNMIKVAADQAGTDGLTLDEINRLSQTAMKQGRKDLQNLVYDTSRFNDAGHLLRFVSPFFNAWFNAMTSWSKLFLENPDLVGKAAVAKNGVWNNPLMVDTTTGERSNSDTPLSNLALVAHLPKGVAKLLGSSDLSYLPISASTLVSPTYADSIGNPGFGPLVQVPVNRLAKMSPSVAEDPAIAWILGGRISSNSLKSAIPSAVAQTLDAFGAAGITGDAKASDSAFNTASLTWQIYQNQMYEYQHGERSNPPNIADIQGQAKFVAGLDTVLNRLMPLGFKPKGAGQFYVDQYHALLNKDPKTAQQEFVKKFGEAGYVFTQSLDNNVAGIPATAGAIKAYKQYESLIAKNPEIASVIVGIQGDGNFDSMAYQWEQANGLRTYQTPAEAAAKANVGQGWYDYESMMSKINVVLQERGLKSISQHGAKDLKDFRKQYEQSTNDPTSQYYNPDWYAAFGGYNKNVYQQKIQALEKVSVDQSMLNNPVRSDIRSLNAYFQFRDQARYYLSDRTNQNLTSSSNKDVANWFDYQVAGLIQNDTKFQQVYDRYLKSDDLTFQ